MSTDEEAKQLTPLNSSTNSIFIDILNGTGPISDKIQSYGTIPKTQNSISFNSCSLLVLYLIFWNLQTTKKLLFPFIIQFALFYNVSIEMFAFIICCYDIGCTISILFHWYTNNTLFNNVYIHLMFFLFMITISILYIILSLSNIFITLIIINTIVGVIFNTINIKTQTILHIAPTLNTNTTDGFYGLHSTNFVATLNWIVVGILLHTSNVNYIWYYIVGCAVIISLLCYFLPHSTIPKTTHHELTTIEYVEQLQSDSISNANIAHIPVSIWKRSYLYWFILNGFFISMSYYAFLSTFGIWMMNKFNLNCEQFGYQLVVMVLGGYVGYSFFEWLIKYEIKTIHISMFTTFACIISTTLLSIALTFTVSSIFVLWTFIFLYAVFSEMVFVSLNVSNLQMISKNINSNDFSNVNLLLDFMNELGIIIGIMGGCYVLKINTFLYLMQCIMFIQFIALGCICVTNFQYNKEKRHTVNIL